MVCFAKYCRAALSQLILIRNNPQLKARAQAKTPKLTKTPKTQNSQNSPKRKFPFASGVTAIIFPAIAVEFPLGQSSQSRLRLGIRIEIVRMKMELI